MITVKQWAKQRNICSAEDNFLSSYAWLTMVIYYLFCQAFIPNLQLKNEKIQVDPANQQQQNINNLDIFFKYTGTPQR